MCSIECIKSKRIDNIRTFKSKLKEESKPQKINPTNIYIHEIAEKLKSSKNLYEKIIAYGWDY